MVTAFDIQFFRGAFLCYSAACLLHVVYMAAAKRRISQAASAFMGLAFVLQTVAMVMRSIHTKHLPLSNMFEYVSVFAWFSAIFYFIMLRIYRNRIIGAFVAPVIFMLIVSASLLPKDPSMQLVPALQSYWLQIHVTLAALGEAAFLVAFAVNIMYFVKKFLPETSSFGNRLPSLDSIDGISHRAIAVGYPLFTVGALFAGAIWAEQAWGIFWSWDPKEVGSLVVWLIYTAYLHARFVRGWRGARAAILSMIGFICAMLTFFANMVLGGLHAYG